MRLPAFTNSLHVRLSGLFLVLLSVSGVAFWFWVNATIFSADMGAEEEDWYDNKAEVELDSLAQALAESYGRNDEFRTILSVYGRKILQYNAELVVFDATGNSIASTAPDSLEHAVSHVDPSLLFEMSSGDWDYSSYPVTGNIDAYENRIFEVDHLHEDGIPDAPLVGYLVASFRPMVIGVAELASDARVLGFQAVILGLIYAALCGLIIMSWTTRRLRNMTAHVAELAAGNLAIRMEDESHDEIGVLSRGFDSMAMNMEEHLKELKRNEQFQRQLIANISHDLRTPLSSLRGYVESLGIQGASLSAAERDRYVSIITGNLDHLDRLIEHTLVLSRFDTGQATFQIEEFPLGELVEAVLTRCQAPAERAQVEIGMEGECRSCIVLADPLQIAQVLQNLIENGIKFNKEGGRVTVRLSEAPGRIDVEVEDTGRGIPSEDLPHIFDRFYIGNKSRTRTENGSAADPGQSIGLGLAIASKIVAGHDRRLTVESEVGAGTTFRFSLPAAEPDDDSR